MKRIVLVVALAFGLAGCAGTPVGNFVTGVATTINNPVTATDIYRVKNAYAAALHLAVAYRQFCWSRPYSALMQDGVARPLCQNRRAVVRQMQSASMRAQVAISSADQFVRNNPTLNAASVINAAWQAVTLFQNSVPRVN